VILRGAIMALSYRTSRHTPVRSWSFWVLLGPSGSFWVLLGPSLSTFSAPHVSLNRWNRTLSTGACALGLHGYYPMSSPQANAAY